MIFLSVEDVINFHDDLIQEFGGASGIRDLGLLISAVEVPKATMFGEDLYRDIFDKVAAYLFHIVSNDPFIDGNKRTGTISALIFLNLNNINFEYNEFLLEDLVLKIAKGIGNKETLAQFFREIQ
ncbi:MAG: type II toxin-antitoxin system death-on-curing family toxin [Gammaproteobacteria bacterium]